MSLVIRGGIPRVQRLTVDTTGAAVAPPFPVNYIQIRNLGAEVVRISFTTEDFAAAPSEPNYRTLAATASPEDAASVWEGPAEMVYPNNSATSDGIFLRAEANNTTVEVVFYQKR